MLRNVVKGGILTLVSVLIGWGLTVWTQAGIPTDAHQSDLPAAYFFTVTTGTVWLVGALVTFRFRL